MNTFEAFYDELSKIAVTRSVKEWQKANASGDKVTADQIAQGSGQLGLKPRQLKDISTGGEEAGVDLMMGHKTVPSTGEKNESGYLARKLYKPDSSISRGEFTPQLLQQKQQLTDSARAMSPEAKNMVPAMYGHETHGTGGLQRSTSFHEYVPGISDLRGIKQDVGGREQFSRPREKYMGDIENVENKVLNPMKQQGMTLGDTVRAKSSGGKGINWGNVVQSPQGPKVLDFLPSVQGQSNPAFESYKAHFGNLQPGQEASGSRFGEQTGVAPLRKEVFNPQMNVTKPVNPPTPPIQSGVRPSAPTVPADNADMPTVSPGALRARGQGTQPVRSAPSGQAVGAPLSIRPGGGMGQAAQGAVAHAPQAMTTAPFQLMKKAPGLGGAVGGALQKAEGSIAAKAPGMLGRIGKFFGR